MTPDLVPATLAQAGPKTFADASDWWQYGVLGVGIVVFAGVIVFLFRALERRNDQIAVERKAIEDERKSWVIEREKWGVEREKMRADFEVKSKEQSQNLARELQEFVKTGRETENGIRREFADMLEGMSGEQTKSSTILANMLDKLTDRITSNNKGGRYGG